MAKVEMYTKAFCPFCIKAKALLKNKGVEFIDIPAAMDRDKRKEMSGCGRRGAFYHDPGDDASAAKRP